MNECFPLCYNSLIGNMIVNISVQILQWFHTWRWKSWMIHFYMFSKRSLHLKNNNGIWHCWPSPNYGIFHIFPPLNYQHPLILNLSCFQAARSLLTKAEMNFISMISDWQEGGDATGLGLGAGVGSLPGIFQLIFFSSIFLLSSAAASQPAPWTS